MTTWREVAERTRGWLPTEEGEFLYELALSVPGPHVEIGTYCGKSTCWIGAAAKEQDTVLFTVDHHRGSPEMQQGADCYDPGVLDENGQHDTLPHARRTIAAAGLEPWVVPVVGDSALVGKHLWVPIGLLFIDGGHGAEPVTRDVELWAPLAEVVAFHDATIGYIGAFVDLAVAEHGWVEIPAPGCIAAVRNPIMLAP